MAPPQTTGDISSGQAPPASIWQVVIRGKWLIVASVVACLVVAAAYLVYKEPVYEARIRLRIGQAGSVGPLEAAELLSSRLLAQYGETVADGVKRPRPFLTRATPSRNQQAAAVELVAEGLQPEDATRLLEVVYAAVRKAHDAILAQNTGPLRERIEHIDAQRGVLTKLAGDTVLLTDRLKSDNPVQASLLVLERARIAESLGALEAERAVLASRLAAPQTQGTSMLGEIVAPLEPAEPRTVLILVTAVLFGVAGGAVLVVIAHDAVRRRESPN